MEEQDPSKMTVPELKSALTQHGFLDKIPQNERKSKAYYVGLYKELVIPILEKERAAKRRSDPVRLQDLIESVDYEPQAKIKSEAKRRQTVAVDKIAALSEGSKKKIQTDFPLPSLKQQPQQPPPTSPATTIVPPELWPVPALATPPKILQQQQQPASRTTTPVKPSPQQQQQLQHRKPLPQKKKTVEVTEEFYEAADDDEEEEGWTGGSSKEYRSPVVHCIQISIVLLTLTAVLSVSLFLVPSITRLPFVADGIDSYLPGFLGFLSPKQHLVYCDNGALPSPLPSHPHINCTRCPTYGICSKGELRCGNGYVLERSKVGNKYVERCVRDEEEVKQVNELKERVRVVLGEHTGAYECKYDDVQSPGMAQETLRDKLLTEFVGKGGKSKDDPATIRQFDKLFFSVIREFLAHPEWNVVIKDSVWTSKDRTLPFMCDMKVRLWELKWYFLFSLVLASLVQALFWSRAKKATVTKEVEALVEEVKKLLCQQKEASRVNDKIPPYLPLVHVRDTLFFDNATRKKKFNAKERLAIWGRVVKMLGEDRRIKTVPHMVEGEQQATWEWVSKIMVNQ